MPTNVPSIHSLMDDPAYRAYMKKVPRRHPANRHGTPWQIWVNRGEGKWGTTQRATYPEAWQTFVTYFKSPERPDVTLLSRRVFYAPPGEWYLVKVKLDKARVSSATGEITTHKLEHRWRQKFFWDAVDLHWCGRCRRPSYWMPLFSNHHALRRQPAFTTEDNYRCMICGIRWIAQPSIEQMVTIEPKPEI